MEIDLQLPILSGPILLLKEKHQSQNKKIKKSTNHTKKSQPCCRRVAPYLTCVFCFISGILNLASGVVDLLQFYFPESFDRLPRDSGLFDGPKPTVLESCSVSDLAILLRGNKRKTQPIEFGAHQVSLGWHVVK